jgi:hypothetical protein
MKKKQYILPFLLVVMFSQCGFSQVNSLEIKPEKEALFTPFMIPYHGGAEGLAEFKKEKPHDYLKELWYYSESFYVRRNYFESGAVMNESMIDINRFEMNRKDSEEAIVILPGFKDVLVLLPGNQLIFKPKTK